MLTQVVGEANSGPLLCPDIVPKGLTSMYALLHLLLFRVVSSSLYPRGWPGPRFQGSQSFCPLGGARYLCMDRPCCVSWRSWSVSLSSSFLMCEMLIMGLCCGAPEKGLAQNTPWVSHTQLVEAEPKFSLRLS